MKPPSFRGRLDLHEGKSRKETCTGVASASVINHFFLLAYREFQDNKLSFFLGFLAITIVVFVTALLGSILAKAPVLFSGLAEEEYGEIDLILASLGSTGYSFLNYTRISTVLASPAGSYWQDREDAYHYHAPRLTTVGTLFNRDDCGRCADMTLNPNDKEWIYFGVDEWNRLPPEYVDNVTKSDSDIEVVEGVVEEIDDPPTCYYPPRMPLYGCAQLYEEGSVDIERLIPSGNEAGDDFCFETLCGFGEEVSFYGLELAMEKQAEIGRSWPHGTVGYGEAFVSTKIINALHLNVGDTVLVQLNVNWVLRGLWTESLFDNNEEMHSRWSWVYVPLSIKGTYSDPWGKHGVGNKKSIIVAFEHLIPLIINSLHPEVPQSVIATLELVDPYHYASQIIVAFPPSRYDVYSEEDADKTVSMGVEFATDIVYRLGAQEIRASMPVVDELKIYRYISMFFGLMLNIILFILMFLSVLLIYSLLSVSVERRTYSFGILRMVGMLSRDVMQMIILQPILSAIPAIGVGLFLAMLGTQFASSIFEDLTGIPLKVGLEFYSSCLAITCGLAIPILASILPIRSALSKSLTDALDTKRSKVMAVKVEISRASGTSISWDLVAFAISLVLFGMLIYYLMPLALLSTNISLLLNIFFSLIIMMLLGLVLLSLNFQHITERVVVWSMFWWEKRGIPQVLVKSLVAHRGRNRFTTVMYALSIAFVIFIYVSYDVNVKATLYNEQQAYGAFYKISKGSDSHIFPRTQMEEFASLHPLIEDYTWAIGDLSEFTSISSTKISNLGRVFQYSNRVYSISPSFFEASLSQFLIVEAMARPALDILQDLYSRIGSATMIVGGAFMDALDIEPMELFLFRRVNNPSGFEYSTVRGLAFLSSCPDFFFSKFPLALSQHSLISFPRWLHLAGEDYDSVDELPPIEFLIKSKSGMSDDEEIKLLQDLTDFVGDISRNGRPLSLYSYDDSNEALEKADIAITFFFGFTTVIAMLICFFSLMSSMYTNVRENAKETGVLRAIGVPRNWIARVAIYESFVIVFSSSLVGVSIGTLVAYTMALQRVLFTEVPIPFSLPWPLLLVIFATSVVCAFISTYRPIQEVLDTKVVTLLRMVF